MYDDRGEGGGIYSEMEKREEMEILWEAGEQMEREEKRTTKKEKMQTIEILVIPDEGLKFVKT